jgi:hypothetical protein
MPKGSNPPNPPAGEARPEAPKYAVLDPERIPIRYVDAIIAVHAGNEIASIVLGTCHREPARDGARQPVEIHVAARLRLTHAFARRLRDALDKMVLAATPAQGGA